jgi:hypothetical protein
MAAGKCADSECGAHSSVDPCFVIKRWYIPSEGDAHNRAILWCAEGSAFRPDVTIPQSNAASTAPQAIFTPASIELSSPNVVARRGRTQPCRATSARTFWALA